MSNTNPKKGIYRFLKSTIDKALKHPGKGHGSGLEFGSVKLSSNGYAQQKEREMIRMIVSFACNPRDHAELEIIEQVVYKRDCDQSPYIFVDLVMSIVDKFNPQDTIYSLRKALISANSSRKYPDELTSIRYNTMTTLLAIADQDEETQKLPLDWRTELAAKSIP